LTPVFNVSFMIEFEEIIGYYFCHNTTIGAICRDNFYIIYILLACIVFVQINMMKAFYVRIVTIPIAACAHYKQQQCNNSYFPHCIYI